MLHYDFPPYCTGVVDSIKMNRRMIGHGALAEKAVRAVMPPADQFPYLVRVFSECTSSNGSSSMASVCGASLALMDAGVPLKAAVAGVSVGMVCNDTLRIVDTTTTTTTTGSAGSSAETAMAADVSPESWLLLTDILGMEDHYGDMDFKIAGTTKGITAIQLDVKLPNGIPLRALEDAISVSREARLKILDLMNEKMSQSRPAFKPHAPLAALVKFDPERRRYLIGTGSEMARYIRTRFEVDLHIEVGIFLIKYL
jgi:polyribonucleotide nucleotidyltransferase